MMAKQIFNGYIWEVAENKGELKPLKWKRTQDGLYTNLPNGTNVLIVTTPTYESGNIYNVYWGKAPVEDLIYNGDFYYETFETQRDAKFWVTYNNN
jgi:hypothetical protein